MIKQIMEDTYNLAYLGDITIAVFTLVAVNNDRYEESANGFIKRNDRPIMEGKK